MGQQCGREQKGLSNRSKGTFIALIPKVLCIVAEISPDRKFLEKSVPLSPTTRAMMDGTNRQIEDEQK